MRHPQPRRRLLQRRHHDLGLLDPGRPAAIRALLASPDRTAEARTPPTWEAAEVSVRAVGLLVRLLGWVRGVGFDDVAEVDVQVGDGDGCRARAEDLE